MNKQDTPGWLYRRRRWQPGHHDNTSEQGCGSAPDLQCPKSQTSPLCHLPPLSVSETQLKTSHNQHTTVSYKCTTRYNTNNRDVNETGRFKTQTIKLTRCIFGHGLRGEYWSSNSLTNNLSTNMANSAIHPLGIDK